MALVVGINVAISLRVLTNPIASCPRDLAKFFPLHWIGVGLIFASGLALLIAYPAKALTNPVFYLKFVALSGGLLIAAQFEKILQAEIYLEHGPAPSPSLMRRLAVGSLGMWIVTISAGRFLAYTNSVLLASRFY